MATSVTRTARRARPLLALGLALTLGACSADGVDPMQPSLSRTGRSSADRAGDVDATNGSGTANVLRRAGGPVVESDTATIDGKGGVLELEAAGLKIVVPKGAVSGPTRFSVRTVAGSLIAYDFQPHGIQFAKPLEFEQDLDKGDFASLDLRTLRLEGAYFAQAGQLDAARGTALVDQFLPIDVDGKKHKVTMKLWHFSGYMMSTGRQATY